MDFKRPISDINPNLNIVYNRIPLCKVVNGDHFRNYDAGIQDSIAACSVSKGSLEIVTVRTEGTIQFPTHRVIEVGDTEVEVLKYPCNGNSSTWVKNARERTNNKQPLTDLTHPSAFIMKCKLGHDIEWNKHRISQLEAGDHIIAERGNHGIVCSINLRLTKIGYITMVQDRIIKKEWKGFKSTKPILRADYNTCCTNKDALACAIRLTEPNCGGTTFRDSEDFAKFCKSGYTALEEPIQRNDIEIKYAPKIRNINGEVIMKWVEKPVKDILIGDHIYSEEGGIPHSLVEKIDGNTLKVICCIDVENEKTVSREIKRVTKEMESGTSVCVARYESSNHSGQAVKKALSLLGASHADEFKDNPADFVMLCKRGDYIRWKTCLIQQLTRGDHIKWGFNNRNHGIVKHVNASNDRVVVYMYKYRGVKCEIVTRKTKFQRAVYNSCYDQETVLKLIESRIGEKLYHPVDNNDFHLARWCKTGKLEKRMVTKELVLSSNMLKPGDQVSWTRIATYDHHALIEEVVGPNKIKIFEFTINKDKKTKGKTYKRKHECKIFDGEDPVYKINHFPPEDPQLLLKEAREQVGKHGGYNVLTNNCENFAGHNKGFASQALAFLRWLKMLFLRMSTKLMTTQVAGIFDDVIEAVVKLSATAGAGIGGDVVIAYGLKCLVNSLHAIGFVIPFGIEFLSILWDINHDWADHKKTRIITGLVGTALISLAMFGCAFPPVSIPASIGLAIFAVFIGIVGTCATTFVMRAIRRKIDQKKCREAFKGMYEDDDTTLQVAKFKGMQVEQSCDISQDIKALLGILGKTGIISRKLLQARFQSYAKVLDLTDLN